MTAKGSRQLVRTSLVLGVQFDEFDYRLFLREYHRDLRQRHGFENFPAYSPRIVLDTLMTRADPACEGDPPGGRYLALRAFARRAHRLHLCLTAADYGKLEQRASPYSFDRAFYHFGREITGATLSMDFPGHSPYRSTRRLHIPFVREHIDRIVDFLPDYLWWAMHDQRDMVCNVLSPEKLHEVRRLIDAAGFKLETFGLYLTTFEVVLMPGESFLDE